MISVARLQPSDQYPQGLPARYLQLTAGTSWPANPARGRLSLPVQQSDFRIAVTGETPATVFPCEAASFGLWPSSSAQDIPHPPEAGRCNDSTLQISGRLHAKVCDFSLLRIPLPGFGRPGEIGYFKTVKHESMKLKVIIHQAEEGGYWASAIS